MTVDWEERASRAKERFEDGAARLPDDADERQRQLTRMGNAAWAAGLSLLMLGREEANEWLIRAAETYRQSWPDAPPGSWGRPIGAMKSRLIAGDLAGAAGDAAWALDAGAVESDSPIGRYAAALAHLVRDDDVAAVSRLATSLEGAEAIPPAVVTSLRALASRDADAYEAAIGALVADFEARDEFLEDIPVADTVLAFQRLATEHGIEVQLASLLLPGR